MLRLRKETVEERTVLVLTGTKYQDRHRCKEVGGGYWNPKMRAWVFPEDSEVLIHDQFPELTAEKEFDFDYDGSVPDFEYKLEPYEHQKRGVAFIIDQFTQAREGCGVLDDMGLGKTKEAIDGFLNLPDRMQLLVVICPKTVVYNWGRELQMHGDFKHIAYYIGPAKQRRKKLKVHLDYPAAIITTYGILRTEWQAHEKGKESPLIKRITISAVMVADEAHYLKNEESGRSKAFASMKPRFRILLTGTPIANRAEDLYQLIHLCDPSIYKSRQHFDYKHVIRELVPRSDDPEKKYYKVSGYKDLTELRNNLQLCAIRRLKENVLDLPDKIFMIRSVELGKKQAAAYKKMRDELLYIFEQMTEEEYRQKRATMNARMLRLQQITSGFVSDGEHGEWLETTKDDCLDELLEEVEQLVVWCVFRPTVTRLADKYKGSVIIGQQSGKVRQEHIDNFINGETRVLVGQVKAGGIGINLVNAHAQVFYDCPPTPEQYAQPIDRLHRIGQTKTVTIVNCLAENTIDFRRYHRLQEKLADADTLTSPKKMSLSDAKGMLM